MLPTNAKTHNSVYKMHHLLGHERNGNLLKSHRVHGNSLKSYSNLLCE
jgi:hypothetical protein